MTPLAPHVTAFFQERLPVERRASPHLGLVRLRVQVASEYASERCTCRLPLTPRADRCPLVVAFLNHLEATRANRPSSRNVRLAAIKSFMHFLEFREPAAIDHIRRILAIPPKKADTRLVRHLTVEEMHAIWMRPSRPAGTAYAIGRCSTSASPAGCACPSSWACSSAT